MIRVALADREQLTAEALARLIDAEEDMRVVRITQSAAPLCAGQLGDESDVLVLDPVGLSEWGFGLVQELRATHPDVGIVVLTASGWQHHIVQALRAGAGAYVRKTSGVQDLLTAIRAVHVGAAVLSKEEMGRLVERRDRGSSVLPSLSPRQQQLLNGIVQGKTNRQIADGLCLSEKTVKNYMQGLFAALGVQDRTGAAVLALRLELVSDEMLSGIAELQAVG